MLARMRRRDLFSLLGAVGVSPLVARAQQADRMRRIGVMIGLNEDDPNARATLSAFRQGLDALGWSEGRNLRIDYRFAGGQIDRIPALAKELVALQPDVIVSQGTAITAALQRESRTIPIVFLTVSDPIGSGFVA